MNNPLPILRTLDQPLTARTELTLFGQAAFALGFAGALPPFRSIHEVDAIRASKGFDDDDCKVDFWLAQQATKAESEVEGLYTRRSASGFRGRSVPPAPSLHTDTRVPPSESRHPPIGSFPPFPACSSIGPGTTTDALASGRRSRVAYRGACCVCCACRHPLRGLSNAGQVQGRVTRGREALVLGSARFR